MLYRGIGYGKPFLNYNRFCEKNQYAMQTFPKNLVGLRNGVRTWGFCGGLFGKSPPHPPKTPQTKGIATLGRKGEHSHSLFRAVEGSFRVPLLQYRLGFLPRSLMDFFEVSHYGVLADVNERLPLVGSSREAGERGRKSPLRHANACHRLAAARSRSGSDTTPWCHSLPSRRFATRGERLIFLSLGRANTVRPYGVEVLCGGFLTQKKEVPYGACS